MPKPKKKKTSGTKRTRAGSKRRGQVAKQTVKPLDSLLTTVRTHPDDVAARLDLAEYYLDHGQTQSIVQALEGLQDRYPFADRKARGRYNFLAASGYLHHKQFAMAEEVGRQGLDEFPGSLSFLCVLVKLHQALREFDKVIVYASQFIVKCDTAEEEQFKAGTGGKGYDCTKVYDALGTACKETGRLERAELYYRQAIESDPGEHRPYLNLIRLLKTVGNTEEAESVVEKGLSTCRQVLELRMIQSSFKKRTSVSACLMVKNEEELLPDCLDSIRDWVDEIIVVDTGSTDKTIKIAESYGAKIYHQEWENDFSKHRNYTVELAKSDWVFIIDADERFDQSGVQPLLTLINKSETEIISLSVYNRYRDSGDLIIGSKSVRFWRRSLNLRYEGIVHNALRIPDDFVITPAPISLEHVGYDLSAEKMDAKFDRTMSLLKVQLDANPRNGDAWFNVAQLLRGRLEANSHQLADEALDAAMRAVEYTDPDVTGERGVHIMSLNHVAAICFLEGDLDRAEEYAERALRLKPGYLDPLMLIGMVRNRRGDHQQAIEAYQTYLDAQADFNEHEESLSLILYYSQSRDAALYGMGQAALALDDSKMAQRYFREVLDQTPDYSDTALQLGQLYLRENRLPEAQKQFQDQLNGNRPLAMAAARLGYISSLREASEDAANWFQQAVELEPENPIVLGNCGVFFREVNEPEKAAMYIEKSLAIDDSQGVLKRHLGELRFGAGRYEEAAQLFQDILKTDGDDPEVLNDLGNCCFKMNQLEVAETYYAKATECPQPPGCAYRNLGLALAGQQKAKEASEALVIYAAMEPEDIGVACLLGDLYCQQLEFQRALEQYERFLLSRPNDALGVYKLSECYRAMGHSDSAAMGYRRVLQLDPEFTPAREKLIDAATSAPT